MDFIIRVVKSYFYMWMLCKKSWPLFCMTINNELHEFKKGRKHMLKKLKKLKLVKKLSMSLLTLAMMVGMVSISSVYAEDYEADTSKTYAIVDTKTNLAINAQDTANAKVLVNAEVKDSLTSKSALFNIVDYANEATNGRYNLVSLKY